MTSTMTQIPMWKYKNTSYMLSLCFISSKVKDEIAQYIKTWKSQNILIQQHNNFFFDSKGKYIFLLLRNLCKIKKNSWSIVIYFVNFGDKNIS
jgi:hypothetical protein